MEWLSSVLLAIQVISSLAIIILVLLQQGKGADMGSSFGSGSAGSLFGATGAANFLSRTTKWAAVVFFASTAGLAYTTHQPGARQAVDSGVMQGFQPDAAPAGAAVPQVPGAAVPAAPQAGADAQVPAAVPQAPAAVPVAPADASVPAAPAQSDAPAESAAK